MKERVNMYRDLQIFPIFIQIFTKIITMNNFFFTKSSTKNAIHMLIISRLLNHTMQYATITVNIILTSRKQQYIIGICSIQWNILSNNIFCTGSHLINFRWFDCLNSIQGKHGKESTTHTERGRYSPWTTRWWIVFRCDAFASLSLSVCVTASIKDHKYTTMMVA